MVRIASQESYQAIQRQGTSQPLGAGDGGAAKEIEQGFRRGCRDGNRDNGGSQGVSGGGGIS